MSTLTEAAGYLFYHCDHPVTRGSSEPTFHGRAGRKPLAGEPVFPKIWAQRWLSSRWQEYRAL